jgi:endonuclease I
MKKSIKTTLCITISLLIIISAVSPAFAAAPALPQVNTNARHTVCTSLSESARNYYSGQYSYSNLSKLSGAANSTDSYAASQGNQLYNALKTLMSSTQSYFPVYSGKNPGSLAYYWTSTDAVGSSDYYAMFYSDAPSNSTLVSLSREHVWPKSMASFYEKYGGADLHHLRPVDNNINSTRSDHPFGYVNKAFASGTTVGTLDSVTVYWLNPKADLFEVKDDIKGDIARILLYVYCRWGQPNLYSDVSSKYLPPLDSDDNKDSGAKVIESLDTLLQWCEDDPVDTWEMRRNDLIEQVQGNRNVFIDYPELAWLMFSLKVPAGLTSPTKTGCTHNWQIAAHTDATCTSNGYDLKHCSKCGEDRKFIYHTVEHTDSDRNEYCDNCNKKLVLSTQMTKINELKDNTRIVLYHPYSKTSVSRNSCLYGKLAPSNSYIMNSKLDIAEDCCVFNVIATEGGYYLKYKNLYLTSGATGNSLFLTSTPNEYSVWYTQPSTYNSRCLIINKNAVYNDKAQALQYYNGNFTTYSVKDTSNFQFEIYENDSYYFGYPDVHENDWFFEAVKYCDVHNYINGYSNGLFGPADKLQRQDFVVILARIANADLTAYAKTATSLKDVADSKYYTNAVKWAVAKGIVKGYDNGKFGVGDTITREQIVTMLYRYLNSPAVSADSKVLNGFADRNRVSAFAQTAMIWAVKNGIISGKNASTLSPTDSASRAETVTIIMRMDKRGMFD